MMQPLPTAPTRAPERLAPAPYQGRFSKATISCTLPSACAALQLTDAMVMAISASVTVSMGELTMGTRRRMFFVRLQ
ncbi:hypothetical protein TSOC_009077, partial [Tetrabaena socialis]